MGEGFAKTHPQSIVEVRPQVLFPTFESVDSESTYTQVRHRSRFTYADLRDDNRIERIGWQADLTIRLRPYMERGPDVTRTVAFEVKTGQYASAERNQRRVMRIVSEKEDHLVLRATVRFDGDPVAEIRYSTPELASSTNAGYRFVPYDL